MISIRRYLARTLAVTLAAITLLAVAAAYLISQNELEEILDAQLGLEGRIVAGLLPPSPAPSDYRALLMRLHQPGHPARLYGMEALDAADPAPVPEALYHHEERMLSLGFWDAEGEPRLMGPDWHDGEAFPAPTAEGFRWVAYGGQSWRVFSLFDRDSDTWIRIGLKRRFHQEIVERIALNHLWPMLLLLPIALWLMGRVIRRGLAPIEQLSRQVQGRNERDLSPIDSEVPRELAELRQALNDFIGRLGETLERERRFTADAAHELRTPLAGLKIHLDNAIAGESASLGKARLGIERLQRVVEQLLILARLDRRQAAASERVDLRALVMDLAAELWPLAEVRGQHLEIHDAERLFVEANATELGILVRNLLDNALRYTPDGGRIEVVLERGEQGPRLIIRDTGPGIPEALLGKVTERFRRATEQRITGSGLGLSIVVELARRQRAELRLGNRKRGGLEACLQWSPWPEGERPERPSASKERRGALSR